MPTKKRFQIYLDEEQLASLEKVKSKTGASISYLIRKCITGYLKILEKKKI